MPGSALFQVKIPVRITDINYGNHLGNDSLVSILHESRMMWLNSHSFTELNAGGTGLIMKDLAVEYVSESFYGDVLEIKIACGEISRMGFELFFQVTRDAGNQVVARAKTTMICYDYDARKIALVPEALLKLLKGNL